MADSQVGRQTDNPTYRQTDGQANIGETERQTNRNSDSQTDRQKDDRQVHRRR